MWKSHGWEDRMSSFVCIKASLFAWTIMWCCSISFAYSVMWCAKGCLRRSDIFLCLHPGFTLCLDNDVVLLLFFCLLCDVVCQWMLEKIGSRLHPLLQLQWYCVYYDFDTWYCWDDGIVTWYRLGFDVLLRLWCGAAPVSISVLLSVSAEARKSCREICCGLYCSTGRCCHPAH